MKTNQILKSSDRDLFGTIIRQNTKDSMLSVTDLQKAYNHAKYVHGWNDKRIRDIMSNKDTQMKIYYLLEQADLIKAGFPAFMEMIENEGVFKVLKGLGVYKTTGRGANKQTVANIDIWILLAMELNPKIYARVIKWLKDGLISNRIEAANNYKPMNEAISRLVKAPRYADYARAINEKVFGRHEKGIRNQANAEQLQMISKIEELITQSINIGMIHKEKHIFTVISRYKMIAA